MCRAKTDKCVLVPVFCATVHHTQTLIVEPGLELPDKIHCENQGDKVKIK